MIKPSDIVREVEQAAARIRPHIRETLLEPSPYLAELGAASVYLKCENLQHTGSFKVRGAMNKLLSLSEAERAKGVVTASTGNHGAATAFSLNKVRASGLVFVPENAAPAKVKAIKRLGARIRAFGTDAVDAENEGRAYANKNDLTYVPPYNDPKIIGGQGTIGLELTRQLDTIEAAFVALGGGGLISGVAAYLKSVHPQIKIFGCSPENSQVMIQSVKAGEILDLPSLPTLSDGTSGGVEAGSITFGLCRDLIDEYITVSEAEIASSLKQFMQNHHMMIEGSAAVAIASYQKWADRFKGGNVAIVLCGANIGLDILKEIL